MEYQIDFEHIYNYSPDMCISVEAVTGKIISCNQTVLDVLEYTKEECLAMSLFQFYHPNQHDKVTENMISFSTKGVIIHTEFKLMKKNGGTVEVSMLLTPVKDQNGKIIYSNTVWHDISKIKDTERCLKAERERVELQNSIIEEKNKDFLDSVKYAKRIQCAILPSHNFIKKSLPDSFILYKPKDIVAGDFYWTETTENGVLFAAADCTGHGVPGALVSVLCNGALNRSVREFGLTVPGEILDMTRKLVIQEFEKSDDEVSDGMDIALCKIEGTTLTYAGANNPLWIIRDGAILATKANKQPVGVHTDYQPFTTHTIELQKGDLIYIFSDGFVDQFGGEKGKKYKPVKFKNFLLSIQEFPMAEQKDLLNKEFETWKGELEQIDDVCVFGVRI